MDSFSIAGIGCALLAAALFNLTPVLQRDALVKMREVSFRNMGGSLGMMFRNKRWLCGLGVGLLGAIPYIFAMSWSGVTVVQPVTSFGTIVLVIASRKLFSERLGKKAQLGIALIISTPICIAFGQVTNVQKNIAEPSIQAMIFWFTLIILIIIGLCFFIGKRIPILLTGSVGFFFMLGAFFMQAFVSMFALSGYDFWVDFLLIIQNGWTDPHLRTANIYFILLLIFDGLAGYTYQIGLQKVSPTKFHPMQQTLNILLSISAGMIIFGQQVGNWTFFILSLITGICGIILLGKFETAFTSHKLISERPIAEH